MDWTDWTIIFENDHDRMICLDCEFDGYVDEFNVEEYSECYHCPKCESTNVDGWIWRSHRNRENDEDTAFENNRMIWICLDCRFNDYIDNFNVAKDDEHYDLPKYSCPKCGSTNVDKDYS